MEVLVFKTNIRYKKHVDAVATHLNRFTDINRWNFDLQDRDRILRVVGDISPKDIESVLLEAGYYCKELE